jgi:hypothetical protein
MLTSTESTVVFRFGNLCALIGVVGRSASRRGGPPARILSVLMRVIPKTNGWLEVVMKGQQPVS